jgi:hypothetical protein
VKFLVIDIDGEPQVDAEVELWRWEGKGWIFRDQHKGRYVARRMCVKGWTHDWFSEDEGGFLGISTEEIGFQGLAQKRMGL